MSMFSIFNISGSAISAQSQRLNVVASNLANADAVAGPDGQGYKGRQVVFETTPMGSDASSGVRVSAIKESNEPLRKVHNPSHPSADAEIMLTISSTGFTLEWVTYPSASADGWLGLCTVRSGSLLSLMAETRTPEDASEPMGVVSKTTCRPL